MIIARLKTSEILLDVNFILVDGQSWSNICCVSIQQGHDSLDNKSTIVLNFLDDAMNQLMVNCCFGARWFGILRVPLSNNPFHFRGSKESKPPTQTNN